MVQQASVRTKHEGFKVTPAIVNHEKVVMIDFGGQVAMVTDRPERTHEIVDPAKMVSFINDSHDVTAVVIRPYKKSHLKYEFIPTEPWKMGSEGIVLHTGIHAEHGTEYTPEDKHHKKSKHHKHHAFWEAISRDKADNLMTVTALMYKGEGEKNFFVTPKEFEFKADTSSAGHVLIKVVRPVVESLAVRKEGCPHAKDSATADGASACVDSHHMKMHTFEKLWASKAKDSFGKDNPNSFLWCDFETHAVVMTVVVGAPIHNKKTGTHLPLTILDAHVVSDEGTQRMGQEITPDEIVKILLNGKKAKGVMMVDGACSSSCSCAGQLGCSCCPIY